MFPGPLCPRSLAGAGPVTKAAARLMSLGDDADQRCERLIGVQAVDPARPAG